MDLETLSERILETNFGSEIVHSDEDPSSDISENELYHYGIKGMKWGIRRTPEQLGHNRHAKTRSVKRRKSKITPEKAKDVLVKSLLFSTVMLANYAAIKNKKYDQAIDFVNSWKNQKIKNVTEESSGIFSKSLGRELTIDEAKEKGFL